jgi:hypothetical protein
MENGGKVAAKRWFRTVVVAREGEGRDNRSLIAKLHGSAGKHLVTTVSRMKQRRLIVEKYILKQTERVVCDAKYISPSTVHRRLSSEINSSIAQAPSR